MGEHGLLGHVDDARGGRELVSRPPGGKAVAIEPLVDFVEGLDGFIGQAEAAPLTTSGIVQSQCGLHPEEQNGLLTPYAR